MTDLRTYISGISSQASNAALMAATVEAILSLSEAATRIAALVREPNALGDFAALQGSANADGDKQKKAGCNL